MVKNPDASSSKDNVVKMPKVTNPDASSSKGNRAHKLKVPGLIDEGPSCQFPKVYETKGWFKKIPVVLCLSIRDGKPKWVEAKRGSGVWCGKFLWVWDTKRCGLSQKPRRVG